MIDGNPPFSVRRLTLHMKSRFPFYATGGVCSLVPVVSHAPACPPASRSLLRIMTASTSTSGYE